MINLSWDDKCEVVSSFTLFSVAVPYFLERCATPFWRGVISFPVFFLIVTCCIHIFVHVLHTGNYISIGSFLMSRIAGLKRWVGTLNFKIANLNYLVTFQKDSGISHYKQQYMKTPFPCIPASNGCYSDWKYPIVWWL